MSPHTAPSEPITVPDGAPIITEDDGVRLPLQLSSMSEEEGSSTWAELPLRAPPSTSGDKTRKVPAPSA